ncbi:hypothetical protein MMC30_004454 [Trapelia coarctata]|nr:hypothetical protein [Trapelia coarctata]
MFKLTRPARLSIGFLLCLVSSVPAGARPGRDLVQIFPNELWNAATCPYRTINYITQTLPQQCLTTSWARDATVHAGQVASVSLTEASRTEALTTTSAASITIGHPESSTAVPSTSLSTHSGPQQQAETTPTPASPTLDAEQPSGPLPDSISDAESDPLSDNTNFLSFEAWKAQMLKKAGQSLEHVGNTRAVREPRRRPDGRDDALDFLGEDAEIELDFSGFVNSDVASDALPYRNSESTTTERGATGDKDDGVSATKLSKDAGKTCKERSNYASFDCAATVVKTNPECKGATSVLVENKDSYMLNACSAKNKFFIVELCNDILIDTVVLGNFEFFSSTFRTFRVSVSDRYPVKVEKWKDLGTFEARNSREVQAFLVENPLIWARYLRIEFLTYYGNEYYCPVSLLRVHGKTMMDDYRNEVKAGRGEEDVDDDVAEPENDLKNEQSVQPVTKDSSLNDTKSVVEEQVEGSTSSTQPTPAPTINSNQSDVAEQLTLTSGPTGRIPWTTYNGPLYEQYDLVCGKCTSSKGTCDLEFISPIKSAGRSQHGASQIRTPAVEPVSSPSASLTTVAITAANSSSTASTDVSVSIEAATASTASEHGTDVRNTTVSPSTTVASKAQVNHTSQSASKVSHQPPAASPTTQESFFKSVHKRLQQLEANSTLSLQYIEEQSRILREAFIKAEKRQLAKTTAFLEALNSTVLSELREFRLQYDQIWQSTVLELSSQREQSQHEVIALSSRLSILADEVLFQKRMAMLQFVLMLICLGLVIFSSRMTSAGAAYLELPTTVHDMVTRPSTSFSRYLRPGSRSGSPSRPGSRYGLFSRTTTHLRSSSDDANYAEDASKTSAPEYRPPTPVSIGSDKGEEEPQDEIIRQTVIATPGIRRVVSSPAIAKFQEPELKEQLEDDKYLANVPEETSGAYPKFNGLRRAANEDVQMSNIAMRPNGGPFNDRNEDHNTNNRHVENG